MTGNGFSKYDQSEINQSVYCYKGSDVLINKVNIRDADALAEFEFDITLARITEIEDGDIIKGKFGATHLRRIHHYIFQDVYPFAGELRRENIKKGTTDFYKSEYIVENLHAILNELKNDNYLKELDFEVFIAKISYYFSELNIIHPFREGNGRTIREFIRQLAMQAGYTIDWSLVDPDLLLQASISSALLDLEPLKDCIRQSIVRDQEEG